MESETQKRYEKDKDVDFSPRPEKYHNRIVILYREISVLKHPKIFKGDMNCIIIIMIIMIADRQ